LAGELRQRCGLILILPGIEGESVLNHSIAQGLNDAGLGDAIEIFDWTRGRFLLFDNLMNHSRNARQADLLAHRIQHYQQEYPGRPVHLVGHSGGGAMAVMALERLGVDHPVTTAVLLAPALSPRYNLAPALRATDRGIHSLCSRHDALYLGAGTTIFGTVDRKHSFAAGKVGFQVPEGLPPGDADVYRTKLRQVTWHYGMLADGHAGGHLGPSDRRFVRKWIGSIILDHRA
jgi:pimeloyl-ACP methyl ester carboxylesterase